MENMTDNEVIKSFNKFIGFVNRNIEKILLKEDELPKSYFKEGLEARLDVLIDRCKSVKDIKENWAELIYLDKWLRDGWKGLKESGKY